MQIRVKAIDLFCGAGGSSYGAQLAGVEIIAGIDKWKLATKTFAINFPQAKTFSRALEGLNPRQLGRVVGNFDLLLASPECTSHTCAKGAAPRSEDSRRTALQVLRYAKSLKPRWIVLENVVHMRPWPGYEDLKRGLAKAGYNLREQILDASDFGVPQSRRRLFLLADREAQPQQVMIPRRSQKTVRDILDPTGLWPTTPLHKKGRAYPTLVRARRAMNELGSRASFLIVYYGTDGSGGWQRLDRPLRTITTLDRFALVERTPSGPRMRMLQIPELKRAMGFDKCYQFPFGTRRERIKLLGNGVCPPVMAAVVGTLMKGKLAKPLNRAA